MKIQRMNVSYDEFSDVLYMIINDKSVFKSKEIDGIILNYDIHGNVIGAQLLSPRQFKPRSKNIPDFILEKIEDWIKGEHIDG